MRIKDGDLATVLQLRKQQDQAAYRLGFIRINFIRDERLIVDEIEKREIEQREHGDAALRRVGLDPSAHEFTIDEDGTVLRLDGGVWTPVLGGDD